MNTAIVLCSRLDSERIPKKVLRKINGVSVLRHLLNRLIQTNLPIILAVPEHQVDEYAVEMGNYYPGVTLFPSVHSEDPLARINEVATLYKLDKIVRVTHDKILVDIDQIQEALNVFTKSKADYLYFPDITPGTGFEIFSKKCIADASLLFKNVEHVSYAARLVSKNTIRLNSALYRTAPKVNLSLLIDFPEDLQLHEVLFSQLGNNANLNQVIRFINENSALSLINQPPEVSIYTCAYNAEMFIEKAMDSVEDQSVFESAEYIIIDDHSSDTTCKKIAAFALSRPNVKWVRNEINVGLASSSNRALKMARGKYIIRLDADDFFVGKNSIKDMIDFSKKSGFEAVYPDNHYGEFNKIQKGKERHHIGGTLFDKRAINFVKFTDGLRHYEGLDLFTRARDQLKIGYFEKPIFFYLQHPTSMSKTNLETRAEIKRKLEAGICVSKV